MGISKTPDKTHTKTEDICTENNRNMNKTNVAKNIILLYGFSIAKILFPLITLPYLTRVLSVEKYGVVAYVKSIMTYMQLVIDFGFMLSGTKEIVQTKDDK